MYISAMDLIQAEGGQCKYMHNYHNMQCLQAEGKRWYDPRVYLSHASRKEDVIRQQRTLAGAKPLVDGPNVQLSRSFREMIYFSSLTCSTKLTQKSKIYTRCSSYCLCPSHSPPFTCIHTYMPTHTFSEAFVYIISAWP